MSVIYQLLSRLFDRNNVEQRGTDTRTSIQLIFGKETKSCGNVGSLFEVHLHKYNVLEGE